MSDGIITEHFSAGYELIHGARIHTLDQEEAVMDYELLNLLKSMFGEPVVGYIDGIHYQFKPERSIPADALAVPADNHEQPDTLLVQK